VRLKRYSKVSARPTTLLGSDSDRFDAREFEIFQQTQISLIKSHFVLQAALRDRSIASLPILAGKENPVAWLGAHVEADFPHKDEVLAIRMRGAADNSSDLKQLVDAVANAYLKEVVYA
jgi:polysaccharide biosynthesis transport protein